MSIDLKRAHEIRPELRLTVLERFRRKGHEVAVMRVENVAVGYDCVSVMLQCECDFDFVVVERDGRISLLERSDSGKCEAKQTVRRYIVARTARRNGERWKSLGLKEAILDIHERIKAGEYFGNRLGGVIYAQESAELLRIPVADVVAACGELFKEERLQLNGMILTDYVVRFRFPRQMRAIMALIVETPLGWPNGEAGDCYVCGVEQEYEERTGVRRGVEAFGRTNWPDIGMDILATYALEPVATELRFIAQESNPEAKLKSIKREHIPAWLDGLGANHPEINRAAFAEFMFRLFELTLDRIELYKEMLNGNVSAAAIIQDMARHLEEDF